MKPGTRKNQYRTRKGIQEPERITIEQEQEKEYRKQGESIQNKNKKNNLGTRENQYRTTTRKGIQEPERINIKQEQEK